MLYYTVMKDKYPDSSYNHSHEKSAKSFAEALDIKYRIGQNSQPRSLAASQPRSLAASQLRSFAAEGCFCLNNFSVKHTQIFSYKKEHKYFELITDRNKPQGTPSLALRSSPQRIIKECLIKTQSKFFIFFAGSAVKLKRSRHVLSAVIMILKIRLCKLFCTEQRRALKNI